MHVGQVTMLHEYLERAVGRRPEAVALVCRDRRLTWADVDDLSARVADVLRGLGVRRGDRVCVLLENGPELCASILGILRADAVFSVLGPRTPAAKLTHILDDCEPAVLVTAAALAAGYEPALDAAARPPHVLALGLGDEVAGRRWRGHDFERAVAAARPAAGPGRAISLDLAAIVYTSGSTGRPKGVMLTHHNMVSATESITTYLQNRDDDVVLDVLPMSFDYGLYQWLMVTAFGGRLVLEPAFGYVGSMLRLVDDEGVTGLPVVPTMASLLRQHAVDDRRLPGVRYVTSTAAPLTATHVDTLRRLCPRARIYSMYGLTECKRVAYLPPADLDRKPGSVGRAMPNTEVRLVGPDGADVPPGTMGELVVRGPHVMRGYWRQPEATAERLRPGPLPGEMHLWTGDWFTADAEGYLYFVGRRDDMIKTRDQSVSPREVEHALYALPGVQDAVVVGEPDEILGHTLRAFLVLAGPCRYTVEEVLAHCRRSLEEVLVPARVTFLSSVAKTESGKIARREVWAHARAARVGGDDL